MGTRNGNHRWTQINPASLRYAVASPDEHSRGERKGKSKKAKGKKYSRGRLCQMASCLSEPTKDWAEEQCGTGALAGGFLLHLSLLGFPVFILSNL